MMVMGKESLPARQEGLEQVGDDDDDRIHGVYPFDLQ